VQTTPEMWSVAALVTVRGAPPATEFDAVGVLLMTALTITPVGGVSDGDLQRLSPTGVASYGPLAAQSSIVAASEGGQAPRRAGKPDPGNFETGSSECCR
jgi:hypothetical protein